MGIKGDTPHPQRRRKFAKPLSKAVPSLSSADDETLVMRNQMKADKKLSCLKKGMITSRFVLYFYLK